MIPRYRSSTDSSDNPEESTEESTETATGRYRLLGIYWKNQIEDR